jgi:zinc/manganese transport system ATP-binding protein
MSGAIVCRNLTLGYDRHPAVHHLSGTIHQGERLALIGPNGAGKSTLIKAFAGLLRPLSGDCTLQGLSRKDFAYLPQAAELDRSFPISVYDLVSMGSWRRIGLFGGLSAKERGRIAAALAAVGLEGFEQRPIGTLSGGQQQRALFARVLLQDARVILLDEPFAAVDLRTVTDLVGIARQWSAEGRTVITVLHDFELVKQHFPRSLLLAREAIGWGATEDVLTEANLLRARAMQEAFSDQAHVCEADAA